MFDILVCLSFANFVQKSLKVKESSLHVIWNAHTAKYEHALYVPFLSP